MASKCHNRKASLPKTVTTEIDEDTATVVISLYYQVGGYISLFYFGDSTEENGLPRTIVVGGISNVSGGCTDRARITIILLLT